MGRWGASPGAPRRRTLRSMTDGDQMAYEDRDDARGAQGVEQAWTDVDYWLAYADRLDPSPGPATLGAAHGQIIQLKAFADRAAALTDAERQALALEIGDRLEELSALADG